MERRFPNYRLLVEPALERALKEHREALRNHVGHRDTSDLVIDQLRTHVDLDPEEMWIDPLERSKKLMSLGIDFLSLKDDQRERQRWRCWIEQVREYEAELENLPDDELSGGTMRRRGRLMWRKS